MRQFTTFSPFLAAVILLVVAVCVEARGRNWYAQYPQGYSPAPRKFHSAVPYGEGFVYFGGTNGSVSFNDVFYWNLSDNSVSSWTASDPSAPLPAPRHLHAVMPTETGFLVHGGHLGAGVAFADDLWEFDFNTKIWAKVAYMGTTVPPPRAAHAAALIEDAVWIYGGTGPNPESSTLPNIGYEDLWKFNLTTSEWTEVAATNEPGIRTGIIGAENDGRSLIFYGGQDMEGNVYPDTYKYDTRQDRWFQSSYVLPPNSFYQGSSSGGSYFMFGGTNTEESNNSLWEYDVENKWLHLSATILGPPPRVSGSAGGSIGRTFAVHGGAFLPGGSVTDRFYTFE